MNPAMFSLIGRAVAWLTAAFITTEVTTVIEDKVEDATGAQVRTQDNRPTPLKTRIAPTIVLAAVSAISFYAITKFIQKLTKHG